MGDDAPRATTNKTQTQMQMRMLPVAVDEVSAALGRLARWSPRPGASRIFNDAGSARTVGDGKRSMRIVPEDAAREVRRAVRRALDAAGLRLGPRALTRCSLLHSRAGCMQQRHHYDYDPAVLADLSGEQRPLGVLVPLSADAALVVEGDAIPIPLGKMLVFDGGLWHAGAAYADDNLRLHVYVDSPHCPRQPNRFYGTRSD